MIYVLTISTVVFFISTIYFTYRAYILASILTDIEEYYESVAETNQYMYNAIADTYETMQLIDSKNIFETDDDVGTTFQLLNQVITDLKNEFDGETEEKK